MAEPPRLYGLKAIVTQAGSGIGEAIVRLLVKHGADVLAVDDANSNVERLFSKVKGANGVVANYRDPRILPSLIDDAMKSLGSLDILVNDFAVHPDKPVPASNDTLQAMLDRRAELTLGLCRAALPYMKRSPAGRIVNIGYVRSAFAVDAAAAAAKAEQNLAALTRALAAETAAFGITANYVQPGGIMTPRARDIFKRDKALKIGRASCRERV